MSVSLVQALRGGPVRVGTENPAKLRAVRAALASLADEPSLLAVSGTNAASGVPEQPVGWIEIVAGARNRAMAALASGPCGLAFGIEDGLVELPLPSMDPAPRDAAGSSGSAPGPSAVFNIGCAWVTDGQRDGMGLSSGFAYPPAVAGPALRNREPIGALFDALWRQHRAAGPTGAGGDPSGPSGRQGGNIGQLTQGRLDRSAYGAQAILCALVPFLHADLYD
jgi:non-canonical (house-cleaning) NTP pyrophosphatase